MNQENDEDIQFGSWDSRIIGYMGRSALYQDWYEKKFPQFFKGAVTYEQLADQFFRAYQLAKGREGNDAGECPKCESGTLQYCILGIYNHLWYYDEKYEFHSCPAKQCNTCDHIVVEPNLLRLMTDILELLERGSVIYRLYAGLRNALYMKLDHDRTDRFVDFVIHEMRALAMVASGIKPKERRHMNTPVDINTLYEAWMFLENHMIFEFNDMSVFARCIEISMSQVNPDTGHPDADASLNTQTSIRIDCGPYLKPEELGPTDRHAFPYGKPCTDQDLTTNSDTFDKAVVDLANKVLRKYGNDMNKNRQDILDWRSLTV